MKRVFLPLLLSLALLASAPGAYADNNSRRGNDRREHRDNDKHKHRKDHDKGPKDFRKEHKKEQKHRYDRHDKHDKHRHDSHRRPDYGRPTPPPPPPRRFHNGHGHHSNYYRPAPPPRLAHVVRRCCPGARHLRVWEVNPGVYMLRYLLNGIWYMQEVYPSRNSYGRRMRVYEANDYWYGDNGYRYYDDDGGLRISLNGRFLYDGLILPGITLNFNL